MKITRNGFKTDNSLLLNRMRGEFREKNCVVIPGFLEETLIKSILKSIARATFYPQRHTSASEQEFARDLTIRENQLALHQVHLLLNDRKLFAFIETLTGCAGIAGFSGRIYKNMPDLLHQLDWHDDTDRIERLVGVSINFSSPAYRGGIFQIRERKSKAITREVDCQNPGDAHIFRISPDLQHRVTPTVGDFPRVSAAGWFVSNPEFADYLRGKSGR